MPRQVRIEYEGAVYHLLARGDRREPIVLDERDRAAFESLWEQAVARTGWQVFAWVLMNNHYHAVVRTPEPNLVAGMKWLQNTWTRRFNVRHARWGHVFGDRYKSILCEEGVYLSRLIEYVHLNPVRAGLVRRESDLERFRWSSLCDYAMPPRKRRAWVDVGGGLSQFGYTDTAAGRRSYLEGLNETINWEDPKRAGLAEMGGQGLQSTVRRGWYFGAEALRERLLARVEGLASGGRRKPISGYTGREMSEHNERMAERIIEVGLKHYRLGKAELKRLQKGDGRKVLIAAVVRARTPVSLSWIAERLNMGAPSRVSRATREAAALIERSSTMRNDKKAILQMSRILD